MHSITRNVAQQSYTKPALELYSIAKMLKTYQNILLGGEVIICTDQKNLSLKIFSLDQVKRSCLLFKEYALEIHYIKGQENVVADFYHVERTKKKKSSRERG